MAATGEGEVALKGFGSTAEKSGGLLSNLAGAMVKVGEAAAVAGGIVAGVSLKMAADFEASTTRLQTQAHMSAQSVDEVRAGLLKMATEVGKSPTELSEGFYHVASALTQLPPQLRNTTDELNIYKNAVELSKIGNANLEDSTQAVVGVLAAFGKEGMTAAEAAAELNAIVGAGDMRMQQLTAAMATGILPAASTFGLKLKDVGAALATLTDNVTPADEAATRLRMTFSLLGAPSGQAQKALAAIGINATQLGYDMRQPNGLLVALSDLRGHLQHIDVSQLQGGLAQAKGDLEHFGFTTEQVDKMVGKLGPDATEQAVILSKAFGGGRTSAAIMTLLTEFDAFKEKYGAIGEGAKKFQSDWEATTHTFNFQVDRLKAAGEAFAISLGERLLPAATRLVQFLADHVGTLNSWVDALGQIARVVGGELSRAFDTFGSVISRIAGGGGAAQVLFQALSGLGAGGAAGPQESGRLLGRNGRPTGGQTDYQESGAAARRGRGGPPPTPSDIGRGRPEQESGHDTGWFSTESYRTPVVPATQRAAGRGRTGGALGYDLGEAGGGQLAPPPSSAGLTGIAQFANTLGPIIDRAVEVIKRLSSAWSEVVRGFQNGASPLTVLVGVLMRLGVSGEQAVGIAHFLGDAWNRLTSFFGPSLQRLLNDGIRPALADIGRNLGPLASEFMAAFREWEPVLRQAATILVVVLAVALRGLIQILTVVLPPAIHIVLDLLHILVLVMKVAADIIRGDWRGLATDLIGIARYLFDIMLTIWRMMHDAIQLVARAIVEGVVHFFQWLWQQLVGGSIVPDLVNGIINWFTHLAATVFAVVDGWVNSLIKRFGELKDGLLNAAKEIASKLIDYFGGGLNGVLGLFRNFLDALSKIPGVGALVPDPNKTIPNADLGAMKKIVGLAAGGMITNGPQYIVGEGNPAYPEWVIPSDPAHRGRAKGLLGSLIQAIGLAAGGVINPGANPYPAGQCTYYVWSRFPGMPHDGDAGDWGSLPLQHVSSPAAGEIVVYGRGGHYSGYGHVAVVEGTMQGNQFPVSEMNMKGLGIVDSRMSDMTDVLTFLVPGVPGVGSPATGGVGGLSSIAGPLIDKALQAAEGGLGALPEWIRGLAKSVLEKIADKVRSTLSPFGGGNPSGARASGSVLDWIHQAEGLDGVGDDWTSGLSQLISKESGGNPQAHNPSGASGIAQMMPGTFGAHMVPGHADIWNPVDNLASAIRYIQGRYGNPQGIPNLFGGNYTGYDAGGLLPPGLTLAVNNTGRSEVVSPAGAGGMAELVAEQRRTNALLHAILHDQNAPAGGYAASLRAG